MNNSLKIGLSIGGAALVLFLLGLVGYSLMNPDEADKPGTTTTTTRGPDVTYRRPGATTQPSKEPEPTSGEDKIVTKITLDVYDVSVAVGETKMPWVTMTPDEAEDKREIWASSDPAIATVDQIGNITGVKKGSCVVTVKAVANPSVKAEVKVTVTAPATTTGTSGGTLGERLGSKAKEPTYIQGILIANKTYGLPKTFNPGASSEMLAAFSTMKADAAKAGLALYNSSNFRTYELQVDLYNRYVARSGQAAADTYSARPGFSEHQTGLVIDLNSVDDSFAGTPEAEWVAKNAHKYGFIVRYPKGKEAITGYQYEPWHIRYLGVKTATAVYQSGKTLEEYLGITSRYAE